MDRRSLLSEARGAGADGAAAVKHSNNYAEFFGAGAGDDDDDGDDDAALHDDAFLSRGGVGGGGGGGGGGRGGVVADALADGGGYVVMEGAADASPFPTAEARDEGCFCCVRALDNCFDRVPCFSGYQRFRHGVWMVVSGNSSKYGSLTRYWPSLVFETLIVLLILDNIVMAVLVSEEEYATDAHFVSLYYTTEVVSLLVFTVEYALRLWAAPEGRLKRKQRRSRSRPGTMVNLRHGCCSSRLRWIFSPLSILDLVVLLGFYIDALATAVGEDEHGGGGGGGGGGNSTGTSSRTGSGSKGFTALRLLRLLSVFRFERQSKGLKHLKTVLSRKVPELILALFVSVILLLTSATLMYALEGDTHPEFNSISRSLWWSAMTITTVGYGDVSPHTSAGQVVASFVAFMGVCLFALPSAVLGSGLIEVMTETRHAAFVEARRARARARKRRLLDTRRGGRRGRGRGGGGGKGTGAAAAAAAAGLGGKGVEGPKYGRRDGVGSSGGGGIGQGERKSSRGSASPMLSPSFSGGNGALEMTSTRALRVERAGSARSGDRGMPRTLSVDSDVSEDGTGLSARSLEGIGLPRFSDVFDVQNPEHLVAASALLLGDGGGGARGGAGGMGDSGAAVARGDGPQLSADFWLQFRPEKGGLVALHAFVSRRLAQEYLFEHLGQEDEDEDGGAGSLPDDPSPMALRRGGGGSAGSDPFMKL